MPRRSRRSPTTKSASTRAIATKALTLAKKNVPEKKFHDSSALSNPSWTGDVKVFSTIAQGDTVSQREGVVVRPSHLNIRGTYEANAAAAGTRVVRVIVFQSNTTNGTSLTPDEIIDGASVTNSYEIYTSKTWNSKFKYRSLWDRTMVIEPSSSGKGGYALNINIPGSKLKPIKYQVGSSNVQSGELGMLVISNTASSIPTFNYVSRLIYTDA